MSVSDINFSLCTAGLVLMLGLGTVTVVEGDSRLLKVTTSADLALVESWLDANG